jgi:hypothetical protein
MTTNTAKCIHCFRKTASEKYCESHSMSHQKLVSGYDLWKKAYGEISWREYLVKLHSLEQTGSFIKDIIDAELKSSE